MESGGERFFSVDHKGVTSVMSALVANYILCIFSQKIYDFTFTFVTPLGAENDYVITHLSQSVVS